MQNLVAYNPQKHYDQAAAALKTDTTYYVVLAK